MSAGQASAVTLDGCFEEEQMAKAARERLARLLAGEEAGAFSAQLSVPSDALRLEVDGVGQVRLPVRSAQAKKLCMVARPAHFGHGEETILDPAVRDTWEISPGLVSLGGPSWAPALEGALAELADELGVPAGNQLGAELHALLVYGPGQFFVPHVHPDPDQDRRALGTRAEGATAGHYRPGLAHRELASRRLTRIKAARSRRAPVTPADAPDRRACVRLGLYLRPHVDSGPIGRCSPPALTCRL